MSKLVFNYGCMGSGKTTAMLTLFDNYKRRKKKPIIIKPIIDDREGTFIHWGLTKSRITKYGEPTYYFKNLKDDLFDLSHSHGEFGVLFVDEVQFLTREDILILADIVDNKNIDVICYGLKTDVNGELFEGSKHLLALADETKELESLCEIEGCKCKSIAHIRYINGVRDNSGNSVAIEKGDVTYKAVCRKHWLI